MNRSSFWPAAPAFAIAAMGFMLTPAQAAAQEPDGAAIYKQNCQGCHGPKGVPSARMKESYPELKSLADSGLMNALAADSIATKLGTGVGHKKSFAGKLTDAQLHAVALYVKTLPSQTGAP